MSGATPGYVDGYVEAGGLWFHFLDWGHDEAAPPVVLLHGTTENAHAWDEISPVLVGWGYRVIALDCRNHGDSDSSPDPIGPLTLAEDVHLITTALGLERFGLIGLSMGGRQAMTFAGLHPERLDWLVIEDIGPDAPPGAARVRSYLASIPERFETLGAFEAWLRSQIPRASAAFLRHKALTHRRPLRGGGMALKYTPLVSSAASSGQPAIDLWLHIAGIPCPTLVIWGAESGILDGRTAERMVAAMPDARAVGITAAGHAVHEEQPVAYLDALAAFLGTPATAAGSTRL